jgi:hypothetical protein
MLDNLRSNWRYLLLGPLALTAPLTAFLGYYQIPLLSLEGFLSYMILILIGLVVGLIMALGGTLMQALVSSVIIVLIVFSELDRSAPLSHGLRYGHVALFCIFLLSTVFYIIREHLDQFLLIIFGMFWLGVFFNTNLPLVSTILEKSHPQPETSLPPYIHIILDAHIGIEGIPPHIDKNNQFSNELKNKYINQGFRVFGRAYSRYVKTKDSTASFLNFKPTIDPHSTQKVAKKEGEEILTVRPNALFDFLSKQGYIINVLENNHLSYCDEGAGYRLGKCVRYRLIRLAANDPIGILSTLMQKMGIVKKYNEVVATIGWPKIPMKGQSPVSSVIAFNKYVDLLEGVKPGNAYFIHLLIPHGDYVLDEKCSYKKGWNFFNDEEGEKPSPIVSSGSDKKISASEALDNTYFKYIEQVKCSSSLMDKLIEKLNSYPEAQNSTIIIHGDHGSRLSSLEPYLENIDHFTKKDYIQYFSTFFAVRSPNLTPGYVRQPLALDELLNIIVLGKTAPIDNEKEKSIYFSDPGFRTYKRFTLPPFANGIAAQAW